jgi:hypothetical protein
VDRFFQATEAPKNAQRVKEHLSDCHEADSRIHPFEIQLDWGLDDAKSRPLDER